MRQYPRLWTDRLELRPFSLDDAVVVERLAGAREVADTTLTIPHPYPSGAAAAWIASHQGVWDEGAGLALAICARAGGRELLGAINLKISTTHLHGEIGYWIGAEYWGNGYATEAARAVTAYAFTELGLHRVQGRQFTRNVASGRVLQKIGMRFEGVQRDAFQRWGRFEDVAVYAVLDSEREVQGRSANSDN